MSTRQRVNSVLQSSVPYHKLQAALRKIPRTPSVVNLYALHYLVAHDDLRGVEAVLVHRRPESILREVINAPLGRKDYIPLCVAAYNGSPRCTKFLIARGANVHFRNTHGEDLMTTLEAGEKDAVAGSPDNALFIHERFRQCRKFIQERQHFLERERTRPAVNYFARARPPRIQAALRILRWWRDVAQMRHPVGARA